MQSKLIFSLCLIFGVGVHAARPPAKSLSGFNSKTSQQALNLLARGGVAKVYPGSISAEVSNLNCSVSRLAATHSNPNATSCTGSAGNRKFALTGEKATEMYGLLEKVTVAQSFPAADAVELKKMRCHFTQKSGANCQIVK